MNKPKEAYTSNITKQISRQKRNIMSVKKAMGFKVVKTF